MRSSFIQPKRRIVTSNPRPDETYDLKGVNLTAPDQVMPKGESPLTINSRGYAREDDERRVAIRSRKGSTFLSTPIGETINTQNVATSTGDLAVSATTWILQPFIPSATNALTRLDLEIKRFGTGGGHVLVDIYSNVAGAPTALLAQGSVLASSITTSYAYLPVHFIDAPTLTNGTTYWMVIRVQSPGEGTYHLHQTAAAGAKSTIDSLASFTTLGVTFRFKTYLATPGKVLGFTRRYPVNANNRTYFFFKSNCYEVTDAGVATSISSAIHANTLVVRTAQVDDKLLWVDGFNPARWYDGTAVTDIPGVLGTPVLLIIHKNRAMFVPKDDPTRVNYSELYKFDSYPSVNFFYVPSPKSSDPVTGWRIFQDNLWIFTHKTKHEVLGSDVASFTRREAVGTKGAISDEAMAVDRNYIYFMDPEGVINRFNGVSDEPISAKMEPEFNSIQDKKTVRLHLYRNQLRVYYAKAPSTTVDRMALFDIATSQWFMDTGRPVVGSLAWDQDENQLIEFSAHTGQMFYGESGNSDLGKAIDFKYHTAYLAYGSGSAKDRVKKFRPVVRPADAPYYLMVGKDVDFKNSPDMRPWLVDAGGAKWGSFNWGDGTKWGEGKQLVNTRAGMSGRGNFTQYRFEQQGVETPVELLGYIALVKSGRLR